MTIAVKRIKSSLKIQTRYCTFHIMQILKQIVFVISLTLISFYGLGQNTNSQTIEIVLVDEYIGFPEGGNGFVDIRSNDEGLNDIFDSYNTGGYLRGLTHYIYNDSVHFIECLEGCDIEQLRLDLENYNSVILRATITPAWSVFTDMLIVELIDWEADGPTGEYTNEGYVITQNNTLNSIFVENKVTFTELLFPESQSSKNYWSLGFEGNLNELWQQLLDATESVATVEYYYADLPILSIEENATIKGVAYPNPINNKISILTTEELINFELYNSVGSILKKASSIEELNTVILTLGSGLYILNIESKDNRRKKFKIIKK